ncbi:MAG: hypothetical protein LYZ69_08550 [Nitrososphaerales archaeon]|nr:hypothetical protein [Nitrososphaerales archaeon]
MEFDIFGRKKRKRQEEEEQRRWQEHWEQERKRKEQEDRRWKELEQKYGVDREELEYQFGRSLTYRRSGDGPQKLTPGHIGIVRVIAKNTGSDAATEPYRDDEFRFLWIDLDETFKGKPNRNVFTSGASGEGKTTLNKLLLSVVDGVKVIFSFKVNDEYLRAGYPVADVSRLGPDPFQDVDAFVSAFAIAFPITTIGITASQIPSLVRELGYGCASWKEFNRRLERRINEAKDKVQLSALCFIQQQLKSLQHGADGDASVIRQLIHNGTSLVLDFSKLSDSAKVFFAELMLRQIWNEIPDNKPIICVDEAHRLTRGTFEKYHSILYEMAKEIRSRGSLWTSTQNYTDIEDDVRNQFATQFFFGTSSKADIEALRAIDPMLAWSVTVLKPHQFLDAKSEEVHARIRVLTFSPEGITKEQAPVSVEEYLSSTPAGATAPRIDYEATVRDKLRDEPVWVSGLAGYFSDRYGVAKDEAKLKVRDILEKLVNGDEVQRMKYDAESGETIVLYFPKSEDEKVSNLHRYMQEQLVKGLDNSEGIVHVAERGEALPDVETGSAYFEVETGLKKRTDDLEERISKFTAKPFIILVPNSEIAKNGRYTALISERVTVTTLAEFLNGAEKP